MSPARIDAVVLAAGEARRFGACKQLLRWQGKSLVQRAVEACRAAGCREVVLVTGAYHEALVDHVAEAGLAELCAVVHNPEWASGMMGSLHCGLAGLEARWTQQGRAAEGVLVTLADQPLVSGEALKKLLAALVAEVDAVGLSYPSGPGVPAVFGAQLLPRLRQLGETAGGRGAKSILRDPQLKIEAVAAPELRIDIDTLADWNTFLDDQGE